MPVKEPEEGATEPFVLRDKQREGALKVVRAWRAGKRAVLTPMAVGTGKTEVGITALRMEIRTGDLTRALWLVHREELLQQPVARIKRRGFTDLLEAGIGIMRAETDDSDRRIIFATVQTVHKPARLARLLSHGSFSHLVIDEAHHVAASTWLRVVDALKKANPDLRILGLTATPKGGSGKHGLDHIFDAVPFKYPMLDAIKDGAIVAPDIRGFYLPVSFKGVKTKGGDYDPEQAGKILAAKNALQVVVAKWLEHGEDRQTLAYCSSVSQAYALAEAFREAGVRARAVSGETARDERAQAVRRFLAGKIKVLCNCQVFTEGTDFPNASCLVQARPTQDDSLYLQILGRVLRTHPGKTDAIVLDFSPRDARDLVLAEEVMAGQGIVPTHAGDGAVAYGLDDETATKKKLRKTPGAIDPERIRVRVLDLLGQKSTLAWIYDGQMATASTGLDSALLAYKVDEGYAVLSIEHGIATPLGMAKDWAEVLVASRWLQQKGKVKVLAQKGESWNGKPPTPGQASFLASAGEAVPATRGEAAAIITRIVCRCALKRFVDTHDDFPETPIGEKAIHLRALKAEQAKERARRRERAAYLQKRFAEMFGEKA